MIPVAAPVFSAVQTIEFGPELFFAPHQRVAGRGFGKSGLPAALSRTGGPRSGQHRSADSDDRP